LQTEVTDRQDEWLAKTTHSIECDLGLAVWAYAPVREEATVANAEAAMRSSLQLNTLNSPSVIDSVSPDAFDSVELQLFQGNVSASREQTDGLIVGCESKLLAVGEHASGREDFERAPIDQHADGQLFVVVRLE